MRVLISGTCPAALNSNYGLLREISAGFEQLAAATHQCAVSFQRGDDAKQCAHVLERSRA